MRVTNYESSNECEDYDSRCDTCVILILIRLEQGESDRSLAGRSTAREQIQTPRSCVTVALLCRGSRATVVDRHHQGVVQK